MPFFDRILFYLNLSFVALMVVAIFGGYIDPVRAWPIAFVGLAYPIILLANLCFIGFWYFRRKRMMWWSVVVVVLSWGQTSQLFAFNPLSSDKGMKIMSWNLKSLDVYNIEGRDAHVDEVIEIIKQEDPDIVALQEFVYKAKGSQFRNMKKIKELGYKFFSFHETVRWHSMHYGVMLLSKYPVKEAGDIVFANSSFNGGVFLDIYTPDGVLRMYNIHLQSIRFDEEETKRMEGLGEDTQVDQSFVRSLSTKLLKAFKLRSAQVAIVKEHIASSPYPVIIAGDFNDTPNSYAYNVVSEDMQDAFLEEGTGFGNTYNGPFPSFRIDYILGDENIEFHDYRRLNVDKSDHFPILCQWDFKDK